MLATHFSIGFLLFLVLLSTMKLKSVGIIGGLIFGVYLAFRSFTWFNELVPTAGEIQKGVYGLISIGIVVVMAYLGYRFGEIVDKS